jgi:hypothetical protein
MSHAPQSASPLVLEAKRAPSFQGHRSFVFVAQTLLFTLIREGSVLLGL